MVNKVVYISQIRVQRADAQVNRFCRIHSPLSREIKWLFLLQSTLISQEITANDLL